MNLWSAGPGCRVGVKPLHIWARPPPPEGRGPRQPCREQRGSGREPRSPKSGRAPRAAGGRCPELTPNQLLEEREARPARRTAGDGASGPGTRGAGPGPGPNAAYVELRDNGAGGGTRRRPRRPRASGGRSHGCRRRSPGRDLKASEAPVERVAALNVAEALEATSRRGPAGGGVPTA